MKKKRFGLLAKIILLTGLLTILTVSTSLSVSLLISYQNTRSSYINNNGVVTDNLESVFTIDESSTVNLLHTIITEYSSIRDEYQDYTPEQKKNYQENVRISLFGPPDGSIFGMTQEKALRRSFYSMAISRMQYLCSSYNIPSSSFSLFDVEKQVTISVASTNFSIDDNFATIGLLEEINENELEFFNSDLDSKTHVFNNTVHSYNRVEIEIGDINYRCFVQGHCPLSGFDKEFSKQLFKQLLITSASAVFLVVIYAVFAKFFLIRNVDKLIESTDTFVDKMKNDEVLEIVDSHVKSTDEIRALSDKIAIMQDQIIKYVDNIREAKSIEEAFAAEVSIASKIQLESLPAPTYFHKNIEFRAFIKPAKGVGGDFYDYFYIDQKHIALIIADVSGKGIPASLFMMRSKESLESAVMNEKDLAKVLFKVNNSLCINNKEGFFVTVFLGVLNLDNYKFDFISAGHERPFIKHNGECKRLEVKSNFVLGLEEDFTYEKQSIQLAEGDSIVLYTDGLNEAINSNKEEFGYERIKTSLEKEDELKQNIVTVIDDLDKFRGEEEQFDDITILSFGIKKNVVSYDYLNPTYNEISDLTDKVDAYLEDLDPIILSKIGVVIDEVMNNIISYGKTKTNKTLTVSIEKTDGGATLIFVDNSHPFNPLLKENRTVQENMEEGIVGGLGISIVKSISKETEYAYSNNKNILIIKF